jgi:hypothetical protein
MMEGCLLVVELTLDERRSSFPGPLGWEESPSLEVFLDILSQMGKYYVKNSEGSCWSEIWCVIFSPTYSCPVSTTFRKHHHAIQSESSF